MVRNLRSPDGRVGALVLACLWGVVLTGVEGILDFKVYSFHYLDNTTNTVYPGWNTILTTTANTSTIAWTLPSGTIMTFTTVENNYPWMSLIPSTKYANGTIVINRANYCLNLIQYVPVPVIYTNDLSVIQQKSDLTSDAADDTLDGKYFLECDIRVDSISYRSALPGLIPLKSEYYAPSLIYYSASVADIMNNQLSTSMMLTTYGPVYFNSDFCGIICLSKPNSTFATDIKLRPCVGQCCWNIFSALKCNQPLFRDASGVRRMMSMAQAVTLSRPVSVQRTERIGLYFNASHTVMYDDFNTMDMDGKVVIAAAGMLMDPRFRYRPAPISYK